MFVFLNIRFDKSTLGCFEWMNISSHPKTGLNQFGKITHFRFGIGNGSQKIDDVLVQGQL